MEAEAELDLLKATHHFLLKQMGAKARRPKE